MTKTVGNGSQAERFKALKVGDQVATPGGGEIWEVMSPWRPGRLILLKHGSAVRSEDPADMEVRKWMVVYGPKRTSNSTNAVVRNAVERAREVVAKNVGGNYFFDKGDRVRYSRTAQFCGGHNDEGTVVSMLGHVKGVELVRVKWDRFGTDDVGVYNLVPVRGKCKFY